MDSLRFRGFWRSVFAGVSLLALFSAQVALAEFAILSSIKAETGTLKTDAAAIPSRSMMSLGGDAMAGLKKSAFFVGAFGEGVVARQAASAAKTAGINLQGSGYSYGGAAGLAFSRVWILARFAPFAVYTLDQKDALI